MKDEEKTKEQLIKELAEMRQRIAELEALEDDCRRTEQVQEWIQCFLKNFSDVIFWIDSEAYVIDVNEAACRSLGYTREELLTMPMCDIDPMFSKKVWSKRWTELRQQGPFVLESSFQTKDGSVFPVEIVVNYLRFDKREYSCAFVRNITARKQMQSGLEESEEKFRLIAETSGDAIFQINMDGVITYCSPAMVNILGYLPEEVIGTNFTMYFNPPELAEDVETFQKILSGERVELLEIQALSKDGMIVHTEVSVAPFIKDGDVAGVQGVARDITKRKLAEAALARTYRELVAKTTELENANEELSQYAYVASHDLRTPLRAIHNYVDFLREDLEASLDEEQQMYLDSLYRAVQEAEALVDDLLQLSRISQRDVLIETIDIGMFLRELIVSLDLPDDVEIMMADDWPMLDIEPVLFRQIFQNLIGNAAKFNKSSHKRVKLGWRSVGDGHYEFFVRDNGIGIEPCYQEQIFRVFERLHTREEFEGTGIGLAIVKKAITKLGGSVRVESKSGEGSTFLLTLPGTKSTTN